ncbi:FAD-dependent oxidoreductase [Natronomonas pharaonis DSM 2160]|uniref:FAD-dependent oxidoreductase n=1 Tax=Natronomonas pharaonis (strain ATCC 35678 / DSM 2160 / CIP 103997 / JCM 8858 / NBRC 14720 / NCIMB 2260 / Gabara) TaxID=348780 RepID=A0A1U7EUP5_NATPD|nr:FAD-dependent oxidoreductase [Natronomonas pharaonis]CAI48706.1 FAD-dependent oxidoreductase [Natronomonas pharaonis DSM 2160]
MDPIETTVAAVREVGPDAVAIDIETPSGFEAAPGQFVKLSAELDGDTTGRFYTVSSPDTEAVFEITVGYDAEEAGAFSEYLQAIEAGDTVTITGPFGNDYYEGEPRAVIIAGGPGVGPAVAIAERALADGHDAAVVYVDDEPLHEDRLASLSAGGANVLVLNGAEQLGDAVADAVTNGDGEQVFVYGFSSFLEDATAAIEAAGGDADAAKTENFG